MRYARLVEQGKDVRLWDDSLRHQIYLGDDAFIQRMQALIEPERARAADVPRRQRRRPDSIQAYLKAYERNEAPERDCSRGGVVGIAGEQNCRPTRIGGAQKGKT